MKLEWILDFPVSPSLLSYMQVVADLAQIKEHICFPCYVSVRICNDPAIQKINAAWRKLDRSTDVLSFPSVLWKHGQTAESSPGLLKHQYDEYMDSCFLGDVIISMDHIRSQANEYGHSEAREAAYLLVHSLCHLMGYDHMEEDEKAIMRKKEEEVLSASGLSRESDQISVTNEELLMLAREAMSRSYSPYSHFPVGAALLASDGRIFQGCNIENASYGAAICAERTAMVKAVSEGATSFEAIAIATKDKPGWPCGICRQFMNEFSHKMRILLTWDNGDHIEESTLDQLLPHQFEL